MVHLLTTPISLELSIHLWIDWISLNSRLMKDLPDLEGVIEVEEDIEVDEMEEEDTELNEMAEEDQYASTIVTRKGIWRDIYPFQGDLGVHI
jgi:hypothetical protein